MNATEWSDWLIRRMTHATMPLDHGTRYRVTTAPIKNKPELSFEIVGTFDRALTQLLFVDDNGVERRINAATITAIEELS